MVGPLRPGATPLSFTYREHGADLERLARTGRAERRHISRLAALDRKLAGRPLSPGDLADALCITDPSGRRLIRKLDRERPCRPAGQCSGQPEGPAEQLYQLTIAAAIGDSDSAGSPHREDNQWTRAKLPSAAGGCCNSAPRPPACPRSARYWPPAAAGASAGSGAVKFSGWDYESALVQQNVDRFTQLNPDVPVEYTPITSAQYVQKTVAEFTGGGGPDALYVYDDSLAGWVAAEYLQPLDGLPGVDEVYGGDLPGQRGGDDGRRQAVRPAVLHRLAVPDLQPGDPRQSRHLGAARRASTSWNSRR